MLAREQALVAEALEVIAGRMPITILGIDSDNDSAFICQTLIDYCQERANPSSPGPAPTASGDQAYIEQKYGAFVRRFGGHERFSGLIAGLALARLF